MQTRGNKRIVYLLSVSVSACLLLFPLLLFSCKKADEPQKEQSLRSVTFSETIITLPDGWSPLTFPTMLYKDGTVTVDVNRVVREDQNGNKEYEKSTAVISRDGTLLSIAGYKDDEQTAVRDTDVSFAPQHADGRIHSIYSMPDGYTAAVEIINTEYEYDLRVNLYDKKGTFLFAVSPAEIQGYDLSRDIGNMSGDIFTVRNIVPFTNGEEMCFCMMTGEGLAAVTMKGETLWSYRSANAQPSALIASGERLLYLTKDRSNLQTLCIFDTETGKPGETIELPQELTRSELSVKMLAGDGYDIYVKNSKGLWGVNLVTDDEGAVSTTAECVVDWIKSNVAYHEILEICILDDRTFMMVSSNFFDIYEPVVLSLHTMIPADQIPEKEEVVLACLCDDFYLQFLVRDFNRVSDRYRIVIHDYSKYATEEARKLAFDTDIASGTVPDMVLLANASQMAGDTTVDTTVETYERSGLFCDLTPLLQADESFRYDDLLTHITKPYQWANGEQYLFPLSPCGYMVFARESSFPGPMTEEAFLDILEKQDKAVPLLNGSPEYYILCAAIEDCCDMEHAVCSYTDGRMEALIERIRALPETEGVDYEINAKKRFIFGQTQLYECSAASLYQYVMLLDELETGEDPVVPIGYPNRDGVLCMRSDNSGYLAITAVSEHKDVCVDFLKSKIKMSNTPRFSADTTIAYYNSDIDVQLSVYEGKTIVIQDRLISVMSDAEAEEAEGRKVKITAEDAERYRQFLNAIERRVDSGRTPVVMFWEEYSANPNRTTAEMLKILQSRVSIYLSEQFD